MKYLTEYRQPELVDRYAREIRATARRRWTLMEVCGGQTHGLLRGGVLPMLAGAVEMVHGPGCPVCVTPAVLIDEAIRLAETEGVVLCSFGDMLRVPGSRRSLSDIRAAGADVRVLYSPLDAVRLAAAAPEREFVFFAVGFETTAPAHALAVLQAERLGLRNFSLLVSQVLVPPAMEAVLTGDSVGIDGFLAAGHVCAIMGTEPYRKLVDRHRVPVVVTGFEPVDLLQGILMAVRQLEAGEHRLENQYRRVVRSEGNTEARRILEKVFDITDRAWRGIGTLPASGLRLRPTFAAFDAACRFRLAQGPAEDASIERGCIAGDILQGRKKPVDCPHFGITCSPRHPVGAPMVSDEGVCAAYYHALPTMPADATS
ncbi:MAG: hypothetical protein RLY31_1971 [Bacteroidota bacterium]|jgi:hydrogenase expression/formation protein HypD